MFFLILGLLFTLALIVSPILAISAYVRLRRMEQRAKGAPTDASLLARLSALERRISEIEGKLAAQAERAPAPAPPPVGVVTPPAPAPTIRAPAPPAGEPARRGGVDLETLIAGRWLNRIGILAVLFAVAFFLKYAFENNWVGPAGRVAIGLLLGSALLVYSEALLRRGYRYFSEGIGGLGAAVLYLSLFAGWSYYQLFSQAVAFGGMIVVTAALTTLAIGRDSQRLALLALLGGLLTPILVSTGKDQQVVLFSYLAVLDGGLLALARWRNWRVLEPISFAGTQVYFWGWYARFYFPAKLEITVAYATLFLILFAALPVIRSRRTEKFAGDQIVLVLVNAFAYLIALRQLMWPEYRWTLTVAVLALAVAHLALARAARIPRVGEAPVARLLFAGLALAFVTLAIPIRLEGRWITTGWAVEGAILIWTGFKAGVRVLRGAGLILFLIVGVRLLAFPIPAERFLLNARFLTFAIAIVCFAIAVRVANLHRQELQASEGAIYGVIGVAANFFLLWSLSEEVYDACGRMRGLLGLDVELAQQLALSLLWTLYASVLIVLGVRRDKAVLRWQALALYGLTIAKVFLFDLSFLERAYRILSFMVLGVVLLVVSFFYTRKLASRGLGEKP